MRCKFCETISCLNQFKCDWLAHRATFTGQYHCQNSSWAPWRSKHEEGNEKTTDMMWIIIIQRNYKNEYTNVNQSWIKSITFQPNTILVPRFFFIALFIDPICTQGISYAINRSFQMMFSNNHHKPSNCSFKFAQLLCKMQARVHWFTIK